MEIAKILLLTVVPAVTLGCIIGVVAGNHQVKKATNQTRSLLSNRQRIACCVSILVGVACVLTGILYNPAGGDELTEGEAGMDDAVMMEGEKDGVYKFEDGGADVVMPETDTADGDTVYIDEPSDENGDIAAEEGADEDTEAAEEVPAGSGNTTGGGTAAAVPVRPRAAPFARSSGGGSVVIVG